MREKGFAPIIILPIVLLGLVVVYGIYWYTGSILQLAPQSTQTASPSPTQVPYKERTQIYVGTYKGVLPCADCSGIDTTLVITPDGYKETLIYQGKNTSYTNEGLWIFKSSDDANVTYLTFRPFGSQSQDFVYQYNNGNLTVVDANGNPLTDTSFNQTLKRVSQ